MSHYRIEKNQMELMLRYMKHLLLARQENITQIKAFTDRYLGQLEEDPVGCMVDILSAICQTSSLREGQAVNAQAVCGTPIPALCGAWVSVRPKRLLVIYPENGGLAAAYTRTMLLGLRTEFIPFRPTADGHFEEHAGTGKRARLEYDRREDTVTLDGKITFSRIYDGLPLENWPQTGKNDKTKKRHETLR